MADALLDAAFDQIRAEIDTLFSDLLEDTGEDQLVPAGSIPNW